jgi:hypothetical protein
LDQRRSQDVTFHSRYEVYSHSGTRRANFPCASASRMRSLRNDKHGYVFVASQDAEQVECDLLFTICTQPRCEARPEPGPTSAANKHDAITPQFGGSWRGVPRLLTMFEHRPQAFDLPLHEASDLHDAQSSSQSVLSSCVAVPCIEALQYASNTRGRRLDDAQGNREFKPSAHLTGVASATLQ